MQAAVAALAISSDDAGRLTGSPAKAKFAGPIAATHPAMTPAAVVRAIAARARLISLDRRGPARPLRNFSPITDLEFPNCASLPPS